MVRVNSDNNSASYCTASQANSGNSFANGLVTTVNYSEIRPRKKNTPVSRNASVEKKCSPWPPLFFQCLHLKNYSNSRVVNSKPTFYCSRRKKSEFVRIILLVENRLNGKFYWLNVCCYRFKIQSLTWT